MRFHLAVPLFLFAMHSHPVGAQTAPKPPEPNPAATKEILDTSEADPLANDTGSGATATGSAEAPQSGPRMDTATDTTANAVKDAATELARPKAAAEPKAALVRVPGLSRLDLGGTVQLKALYHDMISERDADKRLSLQLRHFRLDLDGAIDKHFGFRGELKVDGNARAFGVDNAYLSYTVSEWIGFKGGKLKRPFSQEALASSKSLYTIERGELYQEFLAGATGYSSYDLGLAAYGGFMDEGRYLGYELGLFNGKQNEDYFGSYDGQHNETQDQGFKAKDLVLRVNAIPFPFLKLEAAVSTKSAEDKSDAKDFRFAVNTAYQTGAEFIYKRLRLLGEAAWGENHSRLDSRIVSNSPEFFAFYLMGVWREEYSRGRASESVLKVEGLEPDVVFGEGEGTPNDGRLRYTAGLNYFFTPKVSVMADYGLWQSVTEVIGERKYFHDLDLLWRMSF